MRLKLARCLVVLLAVGCSESGGRVTAGETIRGSRSVTQGGPQDIALFRSVVAAGQVPGQEVLDPVGFFAEHGLDLPPADCGEELCLHPMLAVAPRFDGGNWTMAFVAMNSPLDPTTLERPPLHLVIVAERSVYTRNYWRALQSGSRAMVQGMRDEDRISLVVYGLEVTVVAEGVTREGFEHALLDTDALPAAPPAALYDGLAAGGRLAAELDGFEGASRMLLLTSGNTTSGVSSPQRILGLAEAHAREGIALNVIGAGTEYEADVPRALGDLGIGNYAYAEDPADLDRLLRFEGGTTLFPLATDLRIEVEAAPGYRVGRTWGARRASRQSSHATLKSPALFLGHREGADIGGGRRGGGGGLFVELIADAEMGESIGPARPAFTLEASWTSSGGERVTVQRSVVNALHPGQNPDGMWPELSEATEGKAFMMLNMYLAMSATIDFYEDGDCSHALGTYELVAPTIELWQGVYDDPDTWADFELFGDLRDNMESACFTAEGLPALIVQPQFLSYGCMAT